MTGLPAPPLLLLLTMGAAAAAAAEPPRAIGLMSSVVNDTLEFYRWTWSIRGFKNSSLREKPEAKLTLRTRNQVVNGRLF